MLNLTLLINDDTHNANNQLKKQSANLDTNFELLLAINQAALEHRNRPTFLRVVASLLQTTLNLQTVDVYLLDDTAQPASLHLFLGDTSQEGLLSPKAATRQTLAEQASQSQQPVLSNQATYLLLPLSVGPVQLGVIGVQRAAKTPFAEDALSFWIIVANQLAFALHSLPQQNPLADSATARLRQTTSLSQLAHVAADMLTNTVSGGHVFVELDLS